MRGALGWAQNRRAFAFAEAVEPGACGAQVTGRGDSLHEPDADAPVGNRVVQLPCHGAMVEPRGTEPLIS